MKLNILILKSLLLSIFLFLHIGDEKLYAQDPIYTQFYNNPIYYNPGYIGINSGMRARLNYRTQWTGLPVPYKTLGFSTDFAERSIPGSGGFGLIVNSDQAGTGKIRHTDLGIGTAARVPIYENMLAQVGFLISYSQLMIKWDDMIFGDELNPRFGRIYPTSFESPVSNKVSYPDFAVGGVFRYLNLDGSAANVQVSVGGAVQHAFQPNQSFIGLSTNNLPRKLVLNADVVIDVTQGKRSFSYLDNSGYGNLK